jgi:hypothetical protein
VGNKVGTCEVISQAVWRIAKLIMERNVPKASITIHRPLGITYYINENANVIADYLEIRIP